MDQLTYDSFDRLQTDLSTPTVIREIEAGASAQNLWQAIIESGFADAMIPEESNGAGLTFKDAFSLFFLCGQHALPIPLAHTMIVRRSCALNEIDIPEGMISISPLPVTHTEGVVDCRNVPFGKLAEWVLVPHAGASDNPKNLLLPVSKGKRSDTGIHGSLQAHVSWENPLSSGIVLDNTQPWLETAAAITAAQMAGAMDTVLRMTVQYSADRSQFGRPIGKFQAIQQQLSVLAELASASRIAAELGCQESATLTTNVLAAAVAKARTSEAAGTIVSIAHGVHAAMGITAEYDLQLYTRRLIEWRTDYGSAAYWHRRVGDALLASTAPSTLEFLLPTFFPATPAQ